MVVVEDPGVVEPTWTFQRTDGRCSFGEVENCPGCYRITVIAWDVLVHHAKGTSIILEILKERDTGYRSEYSHGTVVR